MKTEGVSFRHAIELLRNEFLPLAAESDDEPKVVKQNSKQKLPTPFTQSTLSGHGAGSAANADHQETLRQVIDYYHETLKASLEALEYLESRGLKNAELIEHFKLGFANRTLAYRLPQKNRKEGAEIRGRLQEVGILRESGHEHFNGSIVVPVLDENGLISEVYGRKLLGNRLRKGTAIHTYLPGPHRGVWNIEAFIASKEIILCEALIDAMTFWVNGFRNVTASYGTAGFTEDHLAAFQQHGIERVYIAYDRDEAGNTALNNRRYRIRGLQKNMSYEQLKLNVLVSCGEHFHVDSFDIYSARHRQGFIKQAAVELGLTEDTLKHDLGKVLLKLEALQDQQIQTTLEQQDKAPTLSDEERDAALELLQSPDLLNRILADFNAAGVVGEETNKLVGYLAGVSRKLDKPLAGDHPKHQRGG
jgi:hypothetical protein